MIAILTPVLGRPQQIKPLLESIASATTTEYQVVFIFSPGDPAIEEAEGTGATRIIVPWQPGKADYAQKLGLGFHSTTEPWLFQGATDLVYHPGWDTAALATAARTKCGVIGTNDLGNSLVRRGKHSTHSLISRAYIDKWGGTADGSGVIFSEHYDHQWSDNEFIETAILRREFAFSRNSVVEHMHPHWDKAEMDSTYEKATRATKRDMTMFVRRRSVVTKLVSEQKRHKRR